MSVFTQVAAAPLNSAIILVNSVIWFVMWNRRMGFEQVALSYRKVVLEKQYYRVITATFTHLDVMHIVFNMATLYSVWILEAMLGTSWYLETTLLLLVAKAGIWLGITHVLVTKLGRISHADSSAVGYSGVLFGWITLMSLLTPSASIPLIGGFSLPIALAPFAQLLITQLLIPRASFMGHLAGLLGGYLVGWGLFDWLRGYWIIMLSLWFSVLCLLSLRANSALPSWIARWVYVSPEYCATTMVAALADNNADSFGTVVRRFMRGGVLHVARPVAVGDIVDAPPSAVQPGAGAGRVWVPAAGPGAGAGAGAAGVPSAGSGGGAAAAMHAASPASDSAGGSGARAQPQPRGPGQEIELPSRAGRGPVAQAGGTGRRTGMPAGGAGAGAGAAAERREAVERARAAEVDIELGEEEEAELPLMAARGGPGPTSTEASLSAGGSAGERDRGNREVHGPGRPRQAGTGASAGNTMSSRLSGGVRGLLQAVGIDGVLPLQPRSSPAPGVGAGGGGAGGAAGGRGATSRAQSRLGLGDAGRRRQGQEEEGDEEEGEGEDERRRLI